MEKNKKIWLSLLWGVILVLAGIFLNIKPVYAVLGLITTAVNAIFNGIAWVFAGLTTLIIDLIVRFAQYNNFVRTEVVIVGWGLLRDLANMFFILMLLIIAFATVLRQEKYSYKTLLAPLLIMAILVNFSKTICGLVIDFAQVIMLSFVNTFKDIGPGNLVKMFNLDKTFSITPKGFAWVTGDWGQLASSFLAMLVSFVALIVVIIICFLLVLRIISLWILVVLSPLAFIFYVMPGAQGYAKKWENKFIKQVIIGPVLAFFLWLAFYAFQVGSLQAPTGSDEELKIAATEVGSANVFAQFVFATAMLIGGLVAAQQLGVVGASLAGRGVSFLQKTGMKMAKTGFRPIRGAAVGLQERFEAATGITLSPKEWVEGYKRAMERRRETRRIRRITKGIEKGWALGSPADAISQFWSWRGAWHQLSTGFRPQAKARSLFEQAAEHRKAAENYEKKAKSLTTEEANTKRREREGLERRRLEKEQSLNQIAKEPITSETMAERKRLEMEKADIEKQITEIDRILQQPTITREERDRYIEQARKERKKQRALEGRAEIFKPDFTLGRLEIMAATNKKLHELAHIDDADQLNAIIEKARFQKDWPLFEAAFMKQAINRNENKVTDHLGYTSDWRGILEMLKNIGKEMGVGTQAQLQLAGNISEICKRTGHWNAVGMTKYEDGKLRPTTELEHIIYAITEAQKVSGQTGIREEDRLAYGYEEPYTRKYHLSPLGILLARIRAPTMMRAPHDVNINTVLHLAEPEISKKILDFDFPIETMEMMREVRRRVVETESVQDRVLDVLRRLGGSS